MPSQRLIDITPGDAIASGVFFDTPNEETPVFSFGENICLDNLGISRYLGATVLDTVSQDIEFIIQNAAPLAQATVFGKTAAWKWNGPGTVALVGQPFTSLQGRIQADTWGNWIIATNGVEKVKVWKGVEGTGFVDLAGANFTRALQIIRRQPYVLALSPDGDPTKVAWCHTSDPETWTTSATNQAGDFNIRDIPGAIVGACLLGDAVAIYSRESLTIGSYIGGAFVWSFNTLLRGVGIFSPRSVCSVDRLNYGLGPQGPFCTDGYSFQLLGSESQREWIEKHLDTSKPWEVLVFHNELINSVEFHWTSKDGLPRRLIWKLGAEKFMPVNLPLGAFSERDVFDYALAGIGKDICRIQRGADWAGIPILGKLHTKFLDAATPDMDKLFDTIRLDGTLAGLTLAADVQGFDPNSLDEPVEEILAQGPALRQHYFGREAQKLRLRFEGTGQWHLSRVQVFGEPGGLLV